MSGETFLYVEPERHPRWQLAAKRVVDVLGAAIGLLITAPVIVLAAIAIRLEDRGPAIYRQVRIGLNGRPFEVYKLRTMAPGSDRDADLEAINERTDGPLFKAAHDPRITRVGAVVRALSIDELPQLFNVLTGTMSLVGPRPAIPDEVEQFDSELLRRHDVKPGITGLWQLEARDNPSFHAYRRLDLLYVDNWSIGLDLYIILATVPMVIAQILNSYRRERELRAGCLRGLPGRHRRSTGSAPRRCIRSGRQRSADARMPADVTGLDLPLRPSPVADGSDSRTDPRPIPQLEGPQIPNRGDDESRSFRDYWV